MIRPARRAKTLGERLVNGCQQFRGGPAVAVVAPLRASIAETVAPLALNLRALRGVTATAQEEISQRTILAAPQKG
jgi:hypothetical protein